MANENAIAVSREVSVGSTDTLHPGVAAAASQEGTAAVAADFHPIRKSLIWRIVDGLLFCGVAGMLLTVAIQVISRLQMNSFPWTEELTRYLFIWTTFLGLAAGFRSTEHARVVILVALFPKLLRGLAVYTYCAAGFLFFGTVAYTGWKLTMQQFRSGEMSPALGIGMYLVTIPVVLGAVLALWAHIESIWVDRTTRERLERGGLDE